MRISVKDYSTLRRPALAGRRISMPRRQLFRIISRREKLPAGNPHVRRRFIPMRIYRGTPATRQHQPQECQGQIFAQAVMPDVTCIAVCHKLPESCMGFGRFLASGRFHNSDIRLPPSFANTTTIAAQPLQMSPFSTFYNKFIAFFSILLYFNREVVILIGSLT